MVRGGAVEGGVLLPGQQGARGHAAGGEHSKYTYQLHIIVEPLSVWTREIRTPLQSRDSKHFMLPSLNIMI